MRNMLLRWVVNTIGLFLAVELVSGITFGGPWWKLAFVAAVFGVVNAYLRPLLKLLTCPLVLLTLGLFTIVINAIMLWLTGRLAGGFGLGFEVESFTSALLGALVVSGVSIAMAILTGEQRIREIEIREIREKEK